MLKLVKWAYSLGVRNERHRIAQYLSSAQAKRFERMNDRFGYDSPIESKKDATEKAKRQSELKKAVDQQVIDIIDGLFHGEDKYERGASVMFPDEGEL